MSSFSVAPPQNLQLHSPLVQLPAEIKHIIYGYCFAAESPIEDAVIGGDRSNKESVLKLGVSLLQTCRRVYHEADRRPLFAQNIFRFTTVETIRAFFNSVDEVLAENMREVEVDVKSMRSDNRDLANAWLKYLTRKADPRRKEQESLYKDAPGLTSLRLNLESWPKIPMFRTELWIFLRSMLSKVEGLERIVVTGASKGSGMARRDPWSPAHYVGADDVGFDDLIPRMLTCVEGTDDEKVIRWYRQDGKIQLEVVSRSHLQKHVDALWAGPSVRRSCKDHWPESGSCTIFGFENRNSNVTEPTTKGPNPSAA